MTFVALERFCRFGKFSVGDVTLAALVVVGEEFCDGNSVLRR